MRTWEGSDIRPPARANKECTAIVEVKHNNLAQNLEPDQGEKTEGDETNYKYIPCVNHDYQNTPDAGNLVAQSKGSTKTQDLVRPKPPSTNLKEEAHHSPDTTKIPNRTSDSDIALNEVSPTELFGIMELGAYSCHRSPTDRQRKVQDDPRHQRTSQGKLSTLGTMDAASYFPRSALELPKTPQLSPPPLKPPPVANPDVPSTQHTT